MHLTKGRLFELNNRIQIIEILIIIIFNQANLLLQFSIFGQNELF